MNVVVVIIVVVVVVAAAVLAGFLPSRVGNPDIKTLTVLRASWPSPVGKA